MLQTGLRHILVDSARALYLHGTLIGLKGGRLKMER